MGMRYRLEGGGARLCELTSPGERRLPLAFVSRRLRPFLPFRDKKAPSAHPTPPREREALLTLS